MDDMLKTQSFEASDIMSASESLADIKPSNIAFETSLGVLDENTKVSAAVRPKNLGMICFLCLLLSTSVTLIALYANGNIWQNDGVTGIEMQDQALGPEEELIGGPDGELLDDVNNLGDVPDNFVDVLGKGFDLKRLDILSSRVGGTTIFEPFDSTKCFSIVPQNQATHQHTDAWENADSFYASVESETGISADLLSDYTLGATLNSKSSSISQGTVEVHGSSYRMWTETKIITLIEDCYTVNPNADPSFMSNLLQLYPGFIVPSQQATTWMPYENFINTFGSHIVTEVTFGASIRQWSFSRASDSYTMRDLQISTCVEFEGPTNVGQLNVEGCYGISEDDIQQAESRSVESTLDVLGGSTDTRNSLFAGRSDELLQSLMNEGVTYPQPIDYRYRPIWEVIQMMAEGTDDATNATKMRTIALNLQQYFEGFLSFGCDQTSLDSIDTRNFLITGGSNEAPVYSCQLVAKGCHSDDSCHVGGAFDTQTYCYSTGCFIYTCPPFGSRVIQVAQQTDQTGGTNDNVNPSCSYHAGAHGVCRNGYQPLNIWPNPDNHLRDLGCI